MTKWNLKERETKELVVHADGMVEERTLDHLFEGINGEKVDYEEVVAYRFEEAEREGLGRALYWEYEMSTSGRRKRKVAVFYFTEAQLRAAEEQTATG